MAKPSTLPAWSDDPTYTSGPDAGGATKLEPAAGVKAQGFVPGTGFASQWINWLLNTICAWIVWLDSRMPEDGDRTVYIPAIASSGALSHSGSTVLSTTNRAVQHFDLSPFLPSGATLKEVRAIVKPVSSSSAGDEMDVTLYKTEISRASPTSLLPTTPTIAGPVEPGTNSNQYAEAAITGLSEVIDKSEFVYFARVRTSNNAGTGIGDVVHGLAVVLVAPGPPDM